MKSLVKYINEQIILEEYNKECNQSMMSLYKMYNDVNINEHILNGKTNGKTIWQDIWGFGKKVLGIAGGIVLGVGAVLGIGAKKFWNWCTSDEEERKKENNNVWPGLRQETKKEIETKKTINKDKIAVNPIDHDTLEKTLAITDSVDDKNKNGFNQTYKDFKEYKGEQKKTLWYAITYNKKDYLAFFGLTIDPKCQIKENYADIFSFSSSQEMLNFFENNNISKEMIEIIAILTAKNSVLKTIENQKNQTVARKIVKLDGLTFSYNKKENSYRLTEKVISNCKIEKIDKEFVIKLNVQDGDKKTKTNESLDEENLLWKLDKWFETREDQKQQFYELIAKYNQTIDVKELQKDLENTDFYSNIKEFVNFLYDDFDFNTEKDYIYQLKKIIEYIKSKKG